MEEEKKDIQEIKSQVTKSKLPFWEKFSNIYTKRIESNTSQFCIPLYNMTKAYQSKKHLDVGCGSGLGILLLSSMYWKPDEQGHLVVLSDFTPNMIEILADRYKQAGFMTNQSNSFFTCLEQLDQQLEFDEESKGTHVKAFVANNQSLPFADNQFDSYTANLSLMLVDNHMNQLKQAYRVLKTGKIAGFSVIGRRQNTTFLTFFPQVMKKRFEIEQIENEYQSFHLGEKREKVIDQIKSVGFQRVKSWYQTIVFHFDEGGDYFDLQSQNPKFRSLIPEGKLDEAREACIEEFKQKFNDKPMTFEALFLIAYK